MPYEKTHVITVDLEEMRDMFNVNAFPAIIQIKNGKIIRSEIYRSWSDFGASDNASKIVMQKGG